MVIGFTKRQIQKCIVAKRHVDYEARVASQTVPYDVWMSQIISQQGEKFVSITDSQEVSVVSYDELDNFEKFSTYMEQCSLKEQKGYVLFVKDKSKLIFRAEELLGKYLDVHRDLQVGYADETEYLKPQWSPDLLQSLFYFGNIFLIKTAILQKVKSKLKDFPIGGNPFIYQLALCCVDVSERIEHIPLVLYQDVSEDNFPWGEESQYDLCKTGHRFSDKTDGELVSVIIPSKDNPALLSQCIHSILENTDYRRMEIIVVDNGSSKKNKERILKMNSLLQESVRFQYIFNKSTFNFSVMCNLGASHAHGKYLLFLNDDVQAVQDDWLEKMVRRAAKEYVGAVGAKLLYPDRVRIQHVGITNTHLGPAHKLQFAQDSQIHYRKYNRVAVNTVGVTGACLLIRSEIFHKIGGFDEKLQVAFNDVALCYELTAKGYRNVCCNDTWLIHHESLSRGYDAGIEKITRLHGERDYLYHKYPQYWNQDPYVNELLVMDILDKGFEAANRYNSPKFQESLCKKPVPLTTQMDQSWYNECLYMGIEFAGTKEQWELGEANCSSEKKRYYVQGWSYATTVDNSRYDKSLLLKHQDTEEIYEISFEPVYRPDMAENLPYIDHPKLSGMHIWIDASDMKQGQYLLGYLWKDCASRQRLAGFTGELLQIK